MNEVIEVRHENATAPEFTTTDVNTSAKKSYKKRLRHSNWFITINTNEMFTDLQGGQFAERAQLLQDVWVSIVDNLHDFVTFIDEKTGEPVAEDRWNRENIERVDNEFSVERGPKTKMLHLHAILMIAHRTKLRLNLDKIRRYVRTHIFGEEDVRTIHLDARSFADAKMTLRDYINKNKDQLKRRGHDVLTEH